jgi:vacuolar-type H+-ATPase subunit F/Vma7
METTEKQKLLESRLQTLVEHIEDDRDHNIVIINQYKDEDINIETKPTKPRKDRPHYQRFNKRASK